MPIRFYVKSFLAKFRSRKTAISTALEGQDFDFGKNSGIKMCKNSTKSKFKADGFVKIAVFETPKLPENDFTSNLRGRKIITFLTLTSYFEKSGA